MKRTIPATDLQVGMLIDDERFRHVMKVGWLLHGRKFVTARAFHPEARVYPNTPFRFLLDDTVQVSE
jgi:hypothetical protein